MVRRVFNNGVIKVSKIFSDQLVDSNGSFLVRVHAYSLCQETDVLRVVLEAAGNTTLLVQELVLPITVPVVLNSTGETSTLESILIYRNLQHLE